MGTLANVKGRGFLVAKALTATAQQAATTTYRSVTDKADVGQTLPLFAWPVADQERRKFSMIRPQTGRDPQSRRPSPQCQGLWYYRKHQKYTPV